MGDRIYDLLDDFEHTENAQDRRQFPLTQPQSRVPPQSMHTMPRDRYRAPRRFEDVNDIAEEEDVRLDSFDRELLQRPRDDRLKEAGRGRARLSLAPKSSKYFGVGPSQPQHSFQARRVESCDDGGPHHHIREPNRSFGQLSYRATLPQESSPNANLGSSSSPAFKAGQRHAENPHIVTQHFPGQHDLFEEPHIAPDSPQQQIIANIRPSVVLHSASAQHNLSYAPPIVQGIPLVFISGLPDRVRTVFPYPTFNAVQSKCFDRVYKSDDNFVLASPTGSGKTVILELAICRAVMRYASGLYKIVYQAPVKALCSERQRDWQKKFGPLGLNCVELTGDTDNADLKNVQMADIIITTPEKWDSMTRKWRDHEKLMRLIRLFLIDEVHILKEERGPVLEAVVSRMKTIGTDVRFIALSATVPNFEDVAAWLGRNAAVPYEPAYYEKFGEEFRPVKLKKYVCGYSGNFNDYQFEHFLDSKLPDIIAKYTQRKPIMVFCFTRASTASTAKMLAKWWSSNIRQERYWTEPAEAVQVRDQELRACIACGVAFHHAGLDINDRTAVERGFIAGNINVICCTSTLAVGVNLPCQFVIIKNTVTFSPTGLQEYTDLEIMQMIGRAGRPQFDDSAIAVIITKQVKVRRYELMVTGQDALESRFHLSLIDHLNAEIGLGTIRDLGSARKWLSGTFLHIRIKRNPAHYKLQGSRSGQGVDEQLDDICMQDLGLLQEYNLITDSGSFTCTEFGDAMARYYVQFDTMKIFMGLQPKAQISEILSALVQASEFKDIRFRSGEKSFYKTLNQSPSIRFAIPVALDPPAHKVSIIIQSVLGAADISWTDELVKHRSQYNTDVNIVFKHVHRLLRCIIDCQIAVGDSIAINHALMVQRSLCARAWDDGPLQMKQIKDVGVVSVRKLVNAGIRSMEELEYTEAHRIEAILGRNPPFGLRLLEQLKPFPKLRVSVQVVPDSTRRAEGGVKVQLKVGIGFMNDNPPGSWQEKPVYVCLLAGTSDGRMIHFARISGKKLGNEQDLIVPALLTGSEQSVNCYVMCDEIAGTMREATVKPKIASWWFPALKPDEPRVKTMPLERPTSNMSKRRNESFIEARDTNNEFDDDGLEDDDLVHAAFNDLDFDHIENYANPTNALTKSNTTKNISREPTARSMARTRPQEDEDAEPKQLENGNWACNHKCKDKAACKHLCCKDGLDKPPKKPAKKTILAAEPSTQVAPRKQQGKVKKTQTKLQLNASKMKSSADIQVLDLIHCDRKQKEEFVRSAPKDFRDLHQLHKNVQKKEPPMSVSSAMHKKPAYCYADGGEHNLSFLEGSSFEQPRPISSDYGELEIDDLSTHHETIDNSRVQNQDSTVRKHMLHGALNKFGQDDQLNLFGDDDSVLGDAMIGLADSEEISANYKEEVMDFDDVEGLVNWDYNDDLEANYSAPNDTTRDDSHDASFSLSKETSSGTIAEDPKEPLKNTRGPFLTSSSSFDPTLDGLDPAKIQIQNLKLKEVKQLEDEPRTTGPPLKKLKMEKNTDQNERTKLSEPVEKGMKEKAVPDAYQGLEPWLYEEFGDIVEVVDNN